MKNNLIKLENGPKKNYFFLKKFAREGATRPRLPKNRAGDSKKNFSQNTEDKFQEKS